MDIGRDRDELRLEYESLKSKLSTRYWLCHSTVTIRNMAAYGFGSLWLCIIYETCVKGSCTCSHWSGQGL